MISQQIKVYHSISAQKPDTSAAKHGGGGIMIWAYIAATWHDSLQIKSNQINIWQWIGDMSKMWGQLLDS